MPTMTLVAKHRALAASAYMPDRARTREINVTLFDRELADLEASATREGLSRMATVRAAIAFYSRFFRDPGVRAAMKTAEDA